MLQEGLGRLLRHSKRFRSVVYFCLLYMRYSSLWTTWVTLENCGTSGRSNTDVYMHWHYPHSLYMHEEKKQTDRAIRTALTAQLCHLLLALELIFHRGMEGDLHMYNMPEGAGVSTWGCFIQLLSVTLMGYDFKKRYTVIFICQFSAWILHITSEVMKEKSVKECMDLLRTVILLIRSCLLSESDETI